MTQYLISFVTYTFAVSGLLIAALCIYKKVMSTMQKGTINDFLRIEHRLDLSPRKSIYVLRAGNEKFLVASDSDRTSCLAKLSEREKVRTQEREMVSEPREFRQNVNYGGVKTFELEEEKIPVLKSLVNRMDEHRR